MQNRRRRRREEEGEEEEGGCAREGAGEECVSTVVSVRAWERAEREGLDGRDRAERQVWLGLT